MSQKGFTLIEMVVVLAVVAILAAILTPTIAQNMNDARDARALNETGVIAAAIATFYKDVGRWPTSDGSDLSDTIQLIHGPGDVPTDGGASDEEFWLSTGGWGAALVDTFTNQLMSNAPGGTADVYPSTATLELRWKGPYLSDLKADPWNSQYSCNIWYTFNTTTNTVAVFSAGQDRVANTSAIQASSTFAIGGDDIVTKIQ
ncbi:MAG: prepilin-type N-terminal cleavage/methylation domain-containing protein [bacterium]|nr:prepilin-type N-terminal cleavage/methylation domain-containing protein [bacterium]